MSSIHPIYETVPAPLLEADEAFISLPSPSRQIHHGRDTSVLTAQSTTPATASVTNARRPQHLPDAEFSFFDDATGQTVSVRQQIWKDDNWNLGGYFTRDREGRRQNIDAWSPSAARGTRGQEAVLRLLQQGRLDPRNLTVTQTHQSMLGADGREHWLPIARQSRGDGLSLFYAMQKAQIPTGGDKWMRSGDTQAFREGFLTARHGDTFLNVAAGVQTVLGIAAAAVKIKSMHAERGSFDIVNRDTGQRLRVTGNARTGSVDGTLYDGRGMPLARQSTSGKDYQRTVTVRPNPRGGPKEPQRAAVSTPKSPSDPLLFPTEEKIRLINPIYRLRAEATTNCANAVESCLAIMEGRDAQSIPMPKVAYPVDNNVFLEGLLGTRFSRAQPSEMVSQVARTGRPSVVKMVFRGGGVHFVIAAKNGPNVWFIDPQSGRKILATTAITNPGGGIVGALSPDQVLTRLRPGSPLFREFLKSTDAKGPGGLSEGAGNWIKFHGEEAVDHYEIAPLRESAGPDWKAPR